MNLSHFACAILEALMKDGDEHGIVGAPRSGKSR